MDQQNQQINPKRTVNFENLRLHSPVKENAIPKRRNDTNSVYSFGLKYSLKVEKRILQNIPNIEYFNLDFKRLKQKLLTDKNFCEAYAKRILLNKNTKKSYASIEKPFPLMKKVSSSQAINKTDDFLHCIIKSPFHKKFNGSLERNIRLRKNRGIDVQERETQKSFFFSKLKELGKKNTFTNKDEDQINFDFQMAINNNNINKGRTGLEETEKREAYEDSISTNPGIFKNGPAQNKNNKDFFLIGSNFGSKNNLRRQTRGSILSLEQMNQQKEMKELEKIQIDILNSIQRAKTKSKLEQGENFYDFNINLFSEPLSESGALKKISNESSVSSISNNFRTVHNFSIHNYNNKRIKTNIKNSTDGNNLLEIKNDNLSMISSKISHKYGLKDDLDTKIIENENDNRTLKNRQIINRNIRLKKNLN